MLDLSIVAYCMKSVALVAYKATGSWPITCPPFDSDSFNARVFEQADIIWLSLHGIETSPDLLYGDDIHLPNLPMPLRVRALSVESLDGLDLSGTLVFATTCHLPKTNFPGAFKRAGATLIGGPGENYGNRKTVEGADKLGAMLIQSIINGTTTALHALDEAKRTLDPNLRADADALEFRVL